MQQAAGSAKQAAGSRQWAVDMIRESGMNVATTFTLFAASQIHCRLHAPAAGCDALPAASCRLPAD
jgi:hypothetical protein